MKNYSSSGNNNEFDHNIHKKYKSILKNLIQKNTREFQLISINDSLKNNIF